jgi:outer membrane protein assembly factor BamB
MRFLFLLVVLVSVAACGPNEDIELAAQCDKSARDYKSYYNPSLGTKNITVGHVPCGVNVLGAPLDRKIVVLSDIAGAVQIVGNNSVQTIFRSGARVDDLKIENGQFLFITSTERRGYELPDFSFKLGNVAENTRCFDVEGGFKCRPDGVYGNGLKFSAIYPRAAVLDGGTLYVADTFGHKVKAFDFSSGALLWAVDSYYPNSLQFIGGRLLVSEEHSNRVVWLDVTTLEKEIAVGCGLDIFADPTATVAQIKAREASGDLTKSNGRSICEGLLYSPNGASMQDDGTFLISDTDNHRVLHIDSFGTIIREIVGFNNPVRAFYAE